MKKVMIIDDDEAINDILCIILRNMGYAVISRNIGESAGRLIEERPDLFVIDKNLPGMDGTSICTQLKSNPSTSAIPVIVISAAHDFVIPARIAGADACIPKPFSRDQLITTVQKLCDHRND